MHNIQETLQLRAGCLRNITIAGHKFKNIPVYERGGKYIQIVFKEYQDSIREDEGSIVFATFRDIVKLLVMHGDSKSGLSTYYIKLCRGKNVSDHMLYRIGQMGLYGSSSINIIGFIK